MKLQILRKGSLLLWLIALALSLNIYWPVASGESSLLDKESRLGGNGESAPIVIDSDRLEGDNEKNIVRFIGNVIAKRGDIIIHCESIFIMFDKSNKTVKELIAEGDVKITQGDRIATGDKAVFENSEEKVILTGTPEIREGDNIIKGAKIIFFMAEDRGIVEADEHTRVNATIHFKKSTEQERE